MAVLNQRLAVQAWIMGDDYSIADIAIFPWVRNLVGFYELANWLASTLSYMCSVRSPPLWLGQRSSRAWQYPLGCDAKAIAQGVWMH